MRSSASMPLPQLCQPAVAHQLGPQGRLLANAQVSALLRQKLRCRQPQHRITQELEPLVVAGQPGGGVGERFIQGRQVGVRRRLQPEAIQEGNQVLAANGVHHCGEWGESRT
jgi:hypothetical protein